MLKEILSFNHSKSHARNDSISTSISSPNLLHRSDYRDPQNPRQAYQSGNLKLSNPVFDSFRHNGTLDADDCQAISLAGRPLYDLILCEPCKICPQHGALSASNGSTYNPFTSQVKSSTTALLPIPSPTPKTTLLRKPLKAISINIRHGLQRLHFTKPTGRDKSLPPIPYCICCTRRQNAMHCVRLSEVQENVVKRPVSFYDFNHNATNRGPNRVKGHSTQISASNVLLQPVNYSYKNLNRTKTSPGKVKKVYTDSYTLNSVADYDHKVSDSYMPHTSQQSITEPQNSIFGTISCTGQVINGIQDAKQFWATATDATQDLTNLKSFHLIMNANTWSTELDTALTQCITALVPNSHSLHTLRISIRGNTLFTRNHYCLSQPHFKYQHLLATAGVSSKYHYWAAICAGTATRQTLRDCPPRLSVAPKAVVQALLKLRCVPAVLIEGAMEAQLKLDLVAAIAGSAVEICGDDDNATGSPRETAPSPAALAVPSALLPYDLDAPPVLAIGAAALAPGAVDEMVRISVPLSLRGTDETSENEETDCNDGAGNIGMAMETCELGWKVVYAEGIWRVGREDELE